MIQTRAQGDFFAEISAQIDEGDARVPVADLLENLERAVPAAVVDVEDFSRHLKFVEDCAQAGVEVAHNFLFIVDRCHHGQSRLPVRRLRWTRACFGLRRDSVHMANRSEPDSCVFRRELRGEDSAGRANVTEGGNDRSRRRPRCEGLPHQWGRSGFSGACPHLDPAFRTVSRRAW